MTREKFAERTPILRPATTYMGLPDREQGILTDLLTCKAHVINPTALAVLKLMDGHLSVAEIAKKLSISHEIAFEQALDDVIDYIGTLDEMGLIVDAPLSSLLEQYWSPVWDDNREKYGFNYVPGLVYWEFTNDCNLRCHMCYNTSGIQRPRELVIEDKLNLLVFLIEVGVNTIIVTGGEPCMNREELIQFLTRCKELGISTQLFTNGTLIDAELADQLVQCGISHVRLSIHGALPSTHDAIAGVEGAYQRALAAGRHLTEKGVRVTWQITASNSNFSELRMALETALANKFFGFRAGSLDLMGRGRDKAHLQLRPQDEVRLWRFIDEATLVYGNRIRIGWGADYCMEEPWTCYVESPLPLDLIDHRDPNVYLRFCKNSLCGTAIRSIGIRADGTLVPCPAMAEIELGPAADIRRIWRESPILQRLRALDMDGFRHCAICGSRYACGGGCRANAFHTDGDVTGPDPRRCRGQAQLLSTPLSGFFGTSEIEAALTQKQMNKLEANIRYLNDVRTEGIGPWIPYWSVIAKRAELGGK